MSEEMDLNQTEAKKKEEESKQDDQNKKHAHKAGGGELEKMKKQLEEALSSRKEYEDAYMRKAAEFENYKKKVLADGERNRVMAAKDIIMRFIPVADNFERAMKSAEVSKDFDGLLKGLQIAHSEFDKIFTEYEVTAIDAAGTEFDPYLHEALFMEERDDVEFPQTVVEEFEKGYKMGDAVIRHSKVKVGRKTDKAPEKSEEKNN